MSDGRSSAPESGSGSESSADEGDSPEPGGGPQRVVSEKSVDDILDSLNETEAATAKDATESDDEVSRTRLEGDYVESTPDESSLEEATEAGDDAVVGGAEVAETIATGDSSDGPTDEPDESDDPAADAAEDPLGDLADRVERGTVTGADVRAAEAGEGRESTPAIDDVELTMDDLEETAIGSGGGVDHGGDAGPLAGSIDPGGDSDAPEAAADDPSGEDESPGFLSRLLGLFSR